MAEKLGCYMLPCGNARIKVVDGNILNVKRKFINYNEIFKEQVCGRFYGDFLKWL